MAVVAFAGLSCSQMPAKQDSRYFAEGVFVSTALPEIAIRLPETYRYVGRTQFELEGVAQVDRHHFVNSDPTGRVASLIILHFEGLLPTNDDTYNYRIPSPENLAGPDYRFSPELVRLGEHDYIHNTWFFDAEESIRANPGRELDRTARLLAGQGYELPIDLMMSRFVRVVDSARKHELILFYLEPLDSTGLRTADFTQEGAGAAVFERLSAQLAARSREVFRVEDG